jgi:hypothetical protein
VAEVALTLTEVTLQVTVLLEVLADLELHLAFLAHL